MKNKVSKIEDIIEQYKKDVKSYRSQGDVLREANVYRELGALYSDLGQLDESRKVYTKALLLYEKCRHYLGKAYALYEYGVLEKESNPRVSKKYFFLAANLFQKEGNKEWYNRATQQQASL